VNFDEGWGEFGDFVFEFVDEILVLVGWLVGFLE
jgi:hypothetical protein